MAKPIRVLIIDDFASVRKSLNRTGVGSLCRRAQMKRAGAFSIAQDEATA